MRWMRDHEWLLKFIQHRVADPRMLRLIQKWLKAGVSEEGTWSETKMGTPQGAVISPLLANLYLHYALDQWVEAWRRKVARGDVVIVRYADDFVMGLQERAEAERFLEELRERLRKFGLELHPEKTRLIAGEAASSQTATPDSNARARSGYREMAEVGRAGLLQLPRDTGKWQTSVASRWIPSPRILHPYPSVRFDAKHPR
jgi:hypothetical protein